VAKKSVKKKKKPTVKKSEEIILFNPWVIEPHDDAGFHNWSESYDVVFQDWKDGKDLHILAETLFGAESDEDMKEWRYFCAVFNRYVYLCRIKLVEDKWVQEYYADSLGSGESEDWFPVSELSHTIPFLINKD